MKQIPLTKGKFALVDDDDFDFLMQWRWKISRGYVVRNSCKDQSIRMHRIINKTPDGYDTDHIDMNRLNNQKCNLRSATRSDNMGNTKKHRDSSGKFKGVYWLKDRKKWQSQITRNGKRKTIGYFLSEVEAAQAYNSSAIKLYGAFAGLNIIA